MSSVGQGLCSCRATVCAMRRGGGGRPAPRRRPGRGSDMPQACHSLPLPFDPQRRRNSRKAEPPVGGSAFLVRLKGLEPTRLTTQEPKSCMSTNSITGAYRSGRAYPAALAPTGGYRVMISRPRRPCQRALHAPGPGAGGNPPAYGRSPSPRSSTRPAARLR